MSRHYLNPLFNPRAVAVIVASLGFTIATSEEGPAVKRATRRL